MRQKTDCAIARACMALIIFLCVNLAADAQKTVSGIVKSSKGNAPVGFATITVKGTNDAAVSDAEGKFVIKLPAGKTTIIVSSVGFVTAEADATSGNVEVLLTETTSSLDEIVVTGYTAQRKKDITGAVSV